MRGRAGGRQNITSTTEKLTDFCRLCGGAHGGGGNKRNLKENKRKLKENKSSSKESERISKTTGLGHWFNNRSAQ